MLLFNDFDLEQYIIIDNGVEIQELPERINNTIDIPSMDGEIYVGHKYGQKLIKVPFFIDARKNNNYVEIVRQIKNILNTNEESKLFLPNELDKYYLAVINSFECEEIYSGVGKGEIEFICYNPFAYSDELKVFESNENKVITVDNRGSALAYPLINVAISKDCHFVQATNWDGRTVLVGSRPDAENTSKKTNTSVVNDPCESTENWLPAGNVVDSDRLVEGSVTISDNGNYIMSKNFGTTTNQKWHGCAVRRNISEDLTDFEVKARFVFKSKVGGSGSSSGSSSGSGTSSVGTYKVTPSALNLRSGAGTKYKVLTTIPKGKILTIVQLSANKAWGKTTYKNKVGWVSMNYLSKYSKSKISTLAETEYKSVENKIGRAELYGFSKTGKKLWKIVVRDSELWYEYIQPEAYIGNTLVLEDKISCPKPKTKKEKDGDKTVTKKIASGSIGSWNDFYGEFNVKRETIKGKQYWTIKVDKIVSNKVTKTLKTSTRVINSKYPSEDLNHVVLWLGQYKDRPVPAEMGLTDLKIYKLNAVQQEDNVINFSAGDELEIDCNEKKVRLNGIECMDKVDIGSEFFSCDPGVSQFICNSDDEDIYVSSIVQERWI